MGNETHRRKRRRLLSVIVFGFSSCILSLCAIVSPASSQNPAPTKKAPKTAPVAAKPQVKEYRYVPISQASYKAKQKLRQQIEQRKAGKGRGVIRPEINGFYGDKNFWEIDE